MKKEVIAVVLSFLLVFATGCQPGAGKANENPLANTQWIRDLSEDDKAEPIKIIFDDTGEEIWSLEEPTLMYKVIKGNWLKVAGYSDVFEAYYYEIEKINVRLEGEFLHIEELDASTNERVSEPLVFQRL